MSLNPVFFYFEGIPYWFCLLGRKVAGDDAPDDEAILYLDIPPEADNALVMDDTDDADDVPKFNFTHDADDVLELTWMSILTLFYPSITHEDDGGNWCCVWDRIYPEEEIETHSMPSLRRTSGFSWKKALCRADCGQELLTGL